MNLPKTFWKRPFRLAGVISEQVGGYGFEWVWRIHLNPPHFWGALAKLAASILLCDKRRADSVGTAPV